jgi:hypothetical protein
MFWLLKQHTKNEYAVNNEINSQWVRETQIKCAVNTPLHTHTEYVKTRLEWPT